MSDKSEFSDADVIYSYTREQAIDCGVLIDVNKMANEAGLKYPALPRTQK